MEIIGYSRKGFLYIDNGVNLVSQQTTSDESNMINKYCSLIEYRDFDQANNAYQNYIWMKKANLFRSHAEYQNYITNIDCNFQEDMINDMDMGQDY